MHSLMKLWAGGDCPGGNCQAGNPPGGNFLGRDCPGGGGGGIVLIQIYEYFKYLWNRLIPTEYKKYSLRLKTQNFLFKYNKQQQYFYLTKYKQTKK